MNLNLSNKNFGFFTARRAAFLGGMAAVGGLSWLLRRYLENRRAEPNAKVPMDTQFTGAYPRGSGAVNEVTGGHPEDMNGMPGTGTAGRHGPIYDGSDLSA